MLYHLSYPRIYYGLYIIGGNTGIEPVSETSFLFNLIKLISERKLLLVHIFLIGATDKTWTRNPRFTKPMHRHCATVAYNYYGVESNHIL